MTWVEEHLLAIKRHAIEQTKFYHSYNISDTFPVVNKVTLIQNQHACTARSGFEMPIHISSTSGSTGTPFSVFQDYKKRNRTIADLKVFGELCNYPSHETMIFFRVLSENQQRTQEQEDRENIYYIDSSDLGEAHLKEMSAAIIDKKPRIIFSYASTLVEIAKYIDSVGGLQKDVTLTSVLTAGEGISENNRLFLERVFRCPVYRRYSDMELGILGQDHGDGGPYELNWGSFYFECLKMDCDAPAVPGEVGRIVITDLFNYAFPMIRYDTGDLAVMEYPDGGFPIYKEIVGRARDCVYATDGRLISPAKISVMMWGTSDIRQWQFIQEGKNIYTLKLNCDPQIDVTQYIEKYRDLMGKDAIVNIEFVDEISVTASNKRRAVI